MIVSNIGRKITSPVRRAYHRRRGNRLKKRAQNFSKVEGLENACLHFSNESKLHFFASEPENDMLLGSPQIKKIHNITCRKLILLTSLDLNFLKLALPHCYCILISKQHCQKVDQKRVRSSNTRPTG